MGKDLWFQTNVTDDGGPICRALRYRDDDKRLSSFLATLQPSGLVEIHENMQLDDFVEVGLTFNAALKEFLNANKPVEGGK